MQEIPTKTTGDQLTAAEFNNLPDELENMIKSTDITLSGGDRFQVAKSTADYSSAGDFYTDSGSPTAYVLTTVGNRKGLTSYVAGARVRFIAANSNSAPATISVNGHGVKSINDINGAALDANEILGGRITEAVYNGTYFILYNDGASSGRDSIYPPGHLNGCLIAQDADAQHDIKINKGSARGENNISNINIPTAGIVKQIDGPWTEGTAAGGFPSGLTLTASTWYHVFSITKFDGTTDGGYDSNLDASQLMADATTYEDYKRVGSVFVDGASNITDFIMHIGVSGERWTYWKTLPNSYSVSGSLPTGVNTTAVDVPPGFSVFAQLNICWHANADKFGLYLFNPGQNNQSVTTPNVSPGYTLHSHHPNTGSNGYAGGAAGIMTDNAQQIKFEQSETYVSGNATFDIYTVGWKE